MIHRNVLALTPGARFGIYEAIAQIGVGGMGEVHRARDEKLRRDVAIKVLPPLFTSVPERLARFTHEARLLAALNHPHVGMIYGLEDIAGTPALVLELVEGDALADRSPATRCLSSIQEKSAADGRSELDD